MHLNGSVKFLQVQKLKCKVNSLALESENINNFLEVHVYLTGQLSPDEIRYEIVTKKK